MENKNVDNRVEIFAVIEEGCELQDASFKKPNVFNNWLLNVKKLVPRNYLGRITRLNFYIKSKYGAIPDVKDFDIVIALLEDEFSKQNYHPNNERDIYEQRLIAARENSVRLEREIAERIVGMNSNYPKMISNDLNTFFAELGHRVFVPNYSELDYVEEFLMGLSSSKILDIVQFGLFNEDYYSVFDLDGNKVVDRNNLIEARNDFSNLLNELSVKNEPTSLSFIFNSNQAYDLLFKPQPETENELFNANLKKSKNLFWEKEYQLALEKIWDAYEGLKTLLDDDTKRGVQKLIAKMNTREEQAKVLHDEFWLLTHIGNDRGIRHHKNTNIEIPTEHEKRYWYFRMLSLISFALEAIYNDK